MDHAHQKKPTCEEVLRLQGMFPRLDYLMCETLLMHVVRRGDYTARQK